MFESVLVMVIIVTIILIMALQLYSRRRCGCTCGCACCKDDVAECKCGCKNRGCMRSADMNMEITGPYELEIPTVGARIIAGVEAGPIFTPSRTSHVGSWHPAPPRVLLYSEPIYSQLGEGRADYEHKNESFVTEAFGNYSEGFTERVNNTRRIYLHYTNWCGFCKKMKPVWEQVKATLADTALEFNEIDEDVAKTPGVTGYPTILMIDENGFRHQYPGPGDFEQLRAWCISPRPQQ